ncbi:MAG: hypothetical protein ACRD0K_08075 [Egibacteraceae bacterium]
MAEIVAIALTVVVMLGVLFAATIVVGVVLVQRGAAKARAVSDRVRGQIRALGVSDRAQAERLRQQLRDSVLRTRSALNHARANQWPVGDVPALLSRIERSASVLDQQLLAVIGERPGSGDLARVSERVADLADACAQLRLGLREGALDLDEGEIRTIRDACRIEGQALRAAQLQSQSIAGS